MFPSVSWDPQAKLVVAIVRRLKWPLIFTLYCALLSWKPIPTLCYLVLFMLIGVWVYQADLEREKNSQDDFTGGGLFFRYGRLVSSAAWVIPVKSEWSGEETHQFAEHLRCKVAERVRHHLPGESVHVLNTVVIHEKNRSLSKEFARILAKTDLGCMVVHFLHFATFGRSMTLHYQSFVRGTYGFFDVVKFVLASPLSAWFWIWPWLNNEYSILSRLSRFCVSSYDDMDLQTIYATSHSILLSELREVLEEEGILTEELRQMIFNQQITSTNVQGVSIYNSPGLNVGSVSQSMNTPPPRGA
jgi:hypothetical protein